MASEIDWVVVCPVLTAACIFLFVGVLIVVSNFMDIQALDETADKTLNKQQYMESRRATYNDLIRGLIIGIIVICFGSSTCGFAYYERNGSN